MLNVTRYITFRTAAASLSALAISLVFGPWLVRKLRDFPDRAGHPAGRPQSHRPKAGTPTMGGLLILTAALVPTLLWADLTNVYVLDRGADDGGIRRDRVCRRLPEDRAPIPSRPVAALQDGLSDPHRHRGRRRAARPAAQGPLQHAAGLSVLQAPDPGPRMVVPAVRGVRARRRSRTRST